MVTWRLWAVPMLHSVLGRRAALSLEGCEDALSWPSNLVGWSSCPEQWALTLLFPPDPQASSPQDLRLFYEKNKTLVPM